MVEKDKIITFRAPGTLKRLVEKYVALDLHMNPSDFYRHAAIEKIKRDAPELYKELFNKNRKGSHQVTAKATQ